MDALSFFIGASIGLCSMQNTDKLDAGGSITTTNQRTSECASVFGGLRKNNFEGEFGVMQLAKVHIEGYNSGVDGNGARGGVIDISTSARYATFGYRFRPTSRFSITPFGGIALLTMKHDGVADNVLAGHNELHVVVKDRKPYVGVKLNYEFSPKWEVRGDIGVIQKALEWDHLHRQNFYNVRVGIERRF